jgi:SRSO17 transposase
MAAAHVPAKTGFATKPALACAMIERALSAQVPFTWVAADSVYGVGAVETVLRRAGKAYVLGVSSDARFNSWGKSRRVAGTAGTITQNLPASDWTRLSAGEGTKGARLNDWAYLELADLDAADYGASRSGLWTRGLLIRRGIADGDLAFFSTWAPAGTSIETLVRVRERLS